MIFLILPVFNRVDSTDKFIQSIHEQFLSEKLNVVIVDDGSVEDYSQFKNKKINEFVTTFVTRGDGNLWWGGGINKGLDFIRNNFNPDKSDVIVFANNDVIIKDGYLLQNMLETLNDSPYSLLHPITINQKSNEIVSSGAIIKSWFPFITKHPKDLKAEYEYVDMLTSRFLVFKYSLILKVPGISVNLPHYNGDYDFSLNAKKHGYLPMIIRKFSVYLDDEKTGLKYHTISNVKEVYASLFSIKSPNSIRYKYAFMKNHKGRVMGAVLACNSVINILFKSVYYLTLNKLKG